MVDANVLINLAHVERLDLFGSIPGLDFVVPEEVVLEVKEAEQARRLGDALRSGHLRRIESTDLAEVEDGATLRQRMGRGEAACLAIANARGWMIASDERGGFLRKARERLGVGRLLNTPGLLVLAIRASVVDIDEADELKALLENKRFRMRFASFRDIIGND